MDKEQRKRMANRTIIQEEDQDIDFTVQVSGDDVELHRDYEQPWDNESGTGPDVSHEVWTMSLDTLKRFIAAAQWCIEKSEAFEAAHPLVDREEMARQHQQEENERLLRLPGSHSDDYVPSDDE